MKGEDLDRERGVGKAKSPLMGESFSVSSESHWSKANFSQIVLQSGPFQFLRLSWLSDDFLGVISFWSLIEMLMRFHSFLKRTAKPVVNLVMEKSLRKSRAPHWGLGQVRKRDCQSWTTRCQVAEFRTGVSRCVKLWTFSTVKHLVYLESHESHKCF